MWLDEMFDRLSLADTVLICICLEEACHVSLPYPAAGVQRSDWLMARDQIPDQAVLFDEPKDACSGVQGRLFSAVRLFFGLAVYSECKEIEEAMNRAGMMKKGYP